MGMTEPNPTEERKPAWRRGLPCLPRVAPGRCQRSRGAWGGRCSRTDRPTAAVAGS